MKHAVLGPGAIGGLMATALGAIGEDVILIVRAEKLAGYPTRLTLEQPNRTITAAVRIAAKLAEPVDVLWVATKAHQLETALDSVQAPAGIVVPLLNGVDHVGALVARFGRDRVVPGSIAVEADRIAEGHFAQRNVVRLNVAASGEHVLGPVLARLEKQYGFVCRFIESEEKVLWTKLSFLAPFALVTSASGKSKSEIFDDPHWKAKLFSTIDEAAAVAAREGAELDAEKIKTGFDALPPTMRSSMAKDLSAGRQLELDAIAGPIVHGGERHKIPTPVTKELMATIKSKVSDRQR